LKDSRSIKPASHESPLSRHPAQTHKAVIPRKPIKPSSRAQARDPAFNLRKRKMNIDSHTILSSPSLSLETINESHRDALYLIAQDETIWAYTPFIATGDGFHRWFDKALHKQQAGEQHAFVVRRNHDRQLVGCTRFYDIQPQHLTLSIGYTWYIPAVWGSDVNSSSKYLLLEYAFETMKVNRVQFMTDIKNVRSRAAIKKIGAKEEGLLRQHMILENGTVRDTVLFSIIKPEWPDVKLRLQAKLGM
jgi:RimJ/RimL family protein N-acetyltransferase